MDILTTNFFVGRPCLSFSEDQANEKFDSSRAMNASNLLDLRNLPAIGGTTTAATRPNYLHQANLRRLVDHKGIQELYFHRCTFQVGQVETILQGLRKHDLLRRRPTSDLTHLIFHDCHFPRSLHYGPELSQALARNVSLTTLVLKSSGGQLGSAGWELGNVIARHANLQFVWLCMPNPPPPSSTLQNPQELLEWSDLLTGLGVTGQTLPALKVENFHWSATMCNALHHLAHHDLRSLEVKGLRSTHTFDVILQCWSSSSRLESLALGSESSASELIIESIFDRLVRLILSCPTLKTVTLNLPNLKIPVTAVIQLLDVLSSSGSKQKREIQLRLKLVFGAVEHDAAGLSDLFDAIASNVHLIDFELKETRATVSTENQPLCLPVNSAAAPLLAGIFAMNAAGRRYMQRDPTDKRRGVTVLASVNHNLDALFFHVRENPFLCSHHKSKSA